MGGKCKPYRRGKQRVNPLGELQLKLWCARADHNVETEEIWESKAIQLFQKKKKAQNSSITETKHTGMVEIAR
jgi:hypothetical protein